MFYYGLYFPFDGYKLILWNEKRGHNFMDNDDDRNQPTLICYVSIAMYKNVLTLTFLLKT